MPNEGEQLPLFKPVTPPLNGERVTQAMLYRALHEMDVAYTNRFNVIFDAINNRSDEVIELRQNFEAHKEDHPGEKTSKRLGKMTPLITGISLVVAAVVAAIKGVLFG